jgi:hypothetical protein
MKIALCLSGYFNSSRDLTSLGVDGFDHINKNILSGNDVDVFIHSWDIENEENIKKLYSPYCKKHVFEKQKDFVPLYKDNKLDIVPHRAEATPYWNVFSQFYSVQECFKLCSKYEEVNNFKYDIIIRARFDLGRINRNTSGPHLGNPHPVQCINFDKSLCMDYFYMANWQYLETEGPADMWFYSNSDNMKNFCRIFDILSNDVYVGSEYQKWAGNNDGGMLNTIKSWKWVFIKTGLWDKKSLLNTSWE